jgi:uncharacterized metal-binding protein
MTKAGLLRGRRNPLRRVFGGSNRAHHLALSQAIAIALALMAYHHPHLTLGGQVWAMPHRSLWLASAASCALQELWATSDRDEEYKRVPRGFWQRLGHWYWLPFGLMVKHRSRWSHGPVLGTVVRAAYGWPWLLLLVVLSPWPVGLGAAIALGFLANDFGHLALDY